jgi:hypothetical protein
VTTFRALDGLIPFQRHCVEPPGEDNAATSGSF